MKKNADENDENCENYIEENYKEHGAKEQISENNTQSMNCPKCAKQFKNKERLKAHVHDGHSGTKSCTHCIQNFEIQSSLRIHMRKVHKKRQEAAVCHNFGKTFSRMKWLRKHKTKCLGESSIVVKVNCTYCEKYFSSQDARRVHKKKKP